jgi:ATP-dependent DNA helicase RecG
MLVSGKSARGKLDASKPTLFIGTHALLFREFLSSERIALSVIDEQHRFGVQQRQALVKDRNGHVMTLSATPIPRTLALSFLGFNDTIDLPEKPQGRKETITKVVPFGKEVATYEWIVKKLEAGQRVYMVFPRVLDEEDGEKSALLSMAEQLKTEHFSRFASGVLYGNMKEEDKTATMQNFASGKTQLLFATTVIEVGVDVPEATVVAVHDATNFGLAQLHQLRGRVGRSDKQGYCFLFSGQRTEEQEARLTYFAAHADGISVAEYDLKSRGAGKLLGSIQSGETELRIASLENIPMVKEAMDLFEVLKKKKISIPNLILAV